MTESLHDQIMANLPMAVLEAIEAGDVAAFQCAIEQLPPEQADRIVAQLSQIGVVVSDVITDIEFENLLAEFDLLIQAIVEVARGDPSRREEVLAVLPKLDAAGYHLGEVVPRIWAGERDRLNLTGGLNYTSARLVQHILDLLVDQKVMPGSLDVEAVAATIPVEVLAAIQAQDEIAFQEAMNRLPTEEREFVTDQLAKLQAHADREAEKWLASLPGEVRQAVLDLDMTRLQIALRELPPSEAENILAQLEMAGVLGDPAPDVTQRLLAEFEPMILAVVAVAKGELHARPQVEALLESLEGQGWNLAVPIQRIWAGERNLDNLTEGLDNQDQKVVTEILKRL